MFAKAEPECISHISIFNFSTDTICFALRKILAVEQEDIYRYRDQNICIFNHKNKVVNVREWDGDAVDCTVARFWI